MLALHFGDGLDLHLIFFFPQQVGAACGNQPETDKGKVRHARDKAHDDHDCSGNPQRLGRGEHLTIDQLAHLFRTGSTGHHDRCGGGQQQ